MGFVTVRDLYDEALDHLKEMQDILESGLRVKRRRFLLTVRKSYLAVRGNLESVSCLENTRQVSEAEIEELDLRYKGLCKKGKIPVD